MRDLADLPRTDELAVALRPAAPEGAAPPPAESAPQGE
jgi:hypothetical protein